MVLLQILHESRLDLLEAPRALHLHVPELLVVFGDAQKRSLVEVVYALDHVQVGFLVVPKDQKVQFNPVVIAILYDRLHR